MSVSAPCLSLSSIRAAKSASASTVAEHQNRKQQRYSRWVGRFVRTAVALCMSIEGYLRDLTKKYISARLYTTQMRFHALAPNHGILDEGEHQQTLTADWKRCVTGVLSTCSIICMYVHTPVVQTTEHSASLSTTGSITSVPDTSHARVLHHRQHNSSSVRQVTSVYCRHP